MNNRSKSVPLFGKKANKFFEMKLAVLLLAVIAWAAVHQTEAGLCNCRLAVFPKIVNGRKSNFSIPWVNRFMSERFNPFQVVLTSSLSPF